MRKTLLRNKLNNTATIAAVKFYKRLPNTLSYTAAYKRSYFGKKIKMLNYTAAAQLSFKNSTPRSSLKDFYMKQNKTKLEQFVKKFNKLRIKQKHLKFKNSTYKFFSRFKARVKQILFKKTPEIHLYKQHRAKYNGKRSTHDVEGRKSTASHAVQKIDIKKSFHKIVEFNNNNIKKNL